jgi:hypothetical protein
MIYQLENFGKLCNQPAGELSKVMCLNPSLMEKCYDDLDYVMK